MSSTKSSQTLLQEIAQIQKMERGKLSVMRETPSGPFYKIQACENKKNVTRYVPRDQVEAVEEAIAGYKLFTALTEEYAQQVIEKTRLEIAAASKKKKSARSNLHSPKIRKSGE